MESVYRKFTLSFVVCDKIVFFKLRFGFLEALTHALSRRSKSVYTDNKAAHGGTNNV